MNDPYLLSSLEKAPSIVGRIVAAVPRDQWDVKIDPDRFTLREAVAHLADWEPIHLDRFRAALENPGGPVEGIDESIRAEEMNYRDTDPLEQIAMFEQRRREVVRWLEGLSPADWSKSVVHSEKGIQTVADQACMLGSHDVYHIDHLTTFL